MPNAASLTERQQKWFASVLEGLERETGRSLAEWAELARACPETAHRKRLAWMKERHGLGQNRASMVLNVAFPPDAGWAEPDMLGEALWADPVARATHEAVRRLALALPEVVAGQRKGFTAYSRRLQFCALRPVKGGVRLGLAIEPDADPALEAAKKEGWSERLHSVAVLASPNSVTPRVAGWLRAAWERS
jgi:hypothetical protein